MKPGDAVIALKHIRSNNPLSPELGRVIPKGYIDIVVTVNDTLNGIGLQNDKDPAGFFWEKKNFRILATEDELDVVLRELELSILN
jgi:hypothetical protein